MGIPVQEPSRLWRDRGFLLLWSGQLTSQFGTGLLQLAVLLHVYSATHSTTATTAAFVAETAPSALLSPWAGVLADRADRRKLLIVADLSRAALLLPLFFDTGLPVVLVVLAAQAAVASVFYPAYGAFVPTVIGPARLASANAVTAGTSAVLSLVSPTVGAALYASFGFALIVTLDAASFLVSVVTLLCLRSRVPSPTARERTTMRADLVVAGRYVRATPVLRLLFTAMVFFALAEAMLSPLLVPFLQGTLHASTAQVGFAFTATSLGSIAGGVVMAAVARRLGATRMFVYGAVAVSVTITAFGLAPTMPFAVGALVLIGLATQFTNVGSMTLLQTQVAEQLRGRVLGAFGAVFGLTALLGAAMPAFAADAIGIRAVVLTGAAFGGGAAAMAVSSYRHLVAVERSDAAPVAVPA